MISAFVGMGLLFGIGLATPLDAGVALDLSLELPADIEAVLWDDLRLANKNFSRVIFSAVLCSDQTLPEVYFDFALSSTQGEVFQGRSKAFILPAGYTEFTNLDLTLPKSPIALQEFDFTPDAVLISQKMMREGFLPAGQYELVMELKSAADPDSLLASDRAKIQLRNPFTVALLSPDGSPRRPGRIDRAALVFRWSSSASRFFLKIWKKKLDNLSAGAVVKSAPIIETARSKPIKMRYYHPEDAYLSRFEAGCTYYWRVTSLVKTSTGLQEVHSPLGAFRIALPPEEEDLVFANLEKMLGPDYLYVLDQLAGFEPTGMIRLDGKQISIGQFLRMAQAFERHEFQMTGVEAE